MPHWTYSLTNSFDMKPLKYILRGPVTSIAGLLIILATSAAATYGPIDWVWNGVAGCGVGCLLLLSPDSIKGIIDAFVKKKTQ